VVRGERFLLNVVVITNALLLDESDWNCSFLRLTGAGLHATTGDLEVSENRASSLNV
jgi:hypothetical protein